GPPPLARAAPEGLPARVLPFRSEQQAALFPPGAPATPASVPRGRAAGWSGSGAPPGRGAALPAGAHGPCGPPGAPGPVHPRDAAPWGFPTTGPATLEGPRNPALPRESAPSRQEDSSISQAAPERLRRSRVGAVLPRALPRAQLRRTG